MSEPQAAHLDLSTISDPDVRRAIRHMQQELDAALLKQQMQFEALLEMLFEKHVGSIGEYKRHLIRAQQKDPRGTRLHDQLNTTNAPTAPFKPIVGH